MPLINDLERARDVLGEFRRDFEVLTESRELLASDVENLEPERLIDASDQQIRQLRALNQIQRTAAQNDTRTSGGNSQSGNTGGDDGRSENVRIFREFSSLNRRVVRLLERQSLGDGGSSLRLTG